MFELRPFERRNNRMTAYNPWDEMERAFFGDGAWNRSLAEFKTDIQDKGDSYLLQADLPGFKKEDIHIDLDGETMTIRAERHSLYNIRRRTNAAADNKRYVIAYSLVSQPLVNSRKSKLNRDADIVSYSRRRCTGSASESVYCNNVCAAAGNSGSDGRHIQ